MGRGSLGGIARGRISHGYHVGTTFSWVPLWVPNWPKTASKAGLLVLQSRPICGNYRVFSPLITRRSRVRILPPCIESRRGSRLGRQPGGRGSVSRVGTPGRCSIRAEAAMSLQAGAVSSRSSELWPSVLLHPTPRRRGTRARLSRARRHCAAGGENRVCRVAASHGRIRLLIDARGDERLATKCDRHGSRPPDALLRAGPRDNAAQPAFWASRTRRARAHGM
jgi:hypothetical protein